MLFPEYRQKCPSADRPTCLKAAMDAHRSFKPSLLHVCADSYSPMVSRQVNFIDVTFSPNIRT